MEEINKIIGKNLLKLRKQAKLTQLELAEKFNYSDKSISKWENGESLPSIDILYDLATFYNTTLDGLTSTNEEVPTKTAKKQPKPKLFPPKLIIPLLSASVVWLCATVLFVLLKITLNINYYMCFVWAWPLTFIVFTVFVSIWGHSKHLFPVLSVLLWATLTSIHLQFLIANINIWPIYFLGIPLQVTIILCDALVRKPKGYYKKLKEEKKAEKAKLHENFTDKKEDE